MPGIQTSGGEMLIGTCGDSPERDVSHELILSPFISYSAYPYLSPCAALAFHDSSFKKTRLPAQIAKEIYRFNIFMVSSDKKLTLSKYQTSVAAEACGEFILRYKGCFLRNHEIVEA
jgi:hypothetical protein